MKPQIAACALLVCLGVPACDKNSPSAKEAELQQKERALAEREADLARKEAEQKLADERRGLEQEKAALDVARAEVEKMKELAQADASEAVAQKLRDAEAKTAKLEEREEVLRKKEIQAVNTEKKLSDRVMDLAGRQPVPDYRPIEDAASFDSTPTADYGIFYDKLSPYGAWYETPDYGYVWQPRAAMVQDDWRPYTRGHWVCSNRGWMWVSDEPFGWACYHYGRWAKLRGRGWVWIPGDEWAPAWVAWHETPNHSGWAPLPPETLVYRGRDWASVQVADFQLGPLSFVFVETRYLAEPIYRHCVPAHENPGYLRQGGGVTQITVYNNQVVMGGPRYRTVRDAVGGGLPFVSVNLDRSRRAENTSGYRVQNGEVNVYAPAVHTPWNAGLKPTQVAGRWHDVQLQEGVAVSPQLVENFQQHRQIQSQEANVAIGKMSGHGEFNQVRGGVFKDNQRLAEEQNRVSSNGAIGPRLSGGTASTIGSVVRGGTSVAGGTSANVAVGGTLAVGGTSAHGGRPHVSTSTLTPDAVPVPTSAEVAKPALVPSPVVGDVAKPSVAKPPVVGDVAKPSVAKPPVAGEVAKPSVERPPVAGEVAKPSEVKPPVVGEVAKPSVVHPPVAGEVAKPSVVHPPVAGEVA
ncbi:MAG: DUF6600 domain-containing protein, partial [Verrucomicrobiota bacterium]